jgi:hypothetical protein
LATLSLVLVLAAACAGPEPAPDTTAAPSRAGEVNPLRNAYFGDLHVHTSYSFDAFVFGTLATPDDAYRFARGGALENALGYDMKLQSGPLDFYAVTDHAAFLGHMDAMSDPEHAAYESELASQLRQARSPAERFAFMRSMFKYVQDERWRQIFYEDVLHSAWQEIVEAAERHYEPGAFTTFIGYEYTSTPENQNLHRNVIFRGNRAPAAPFSFLDSMNPEDLWAWMELLRDEGIETLAIPHNSNESNGLMFSRTSYGGEPLDAAYAELRMRNEPVVEVVQVKGTSETHPMLSPNDEWAAHELYPYLANVSASPPTPSDPPGSYVRDAYLRGLEMQEARGFNPFRFGLIGSSDTHNGASPVEESSYAGIAVIDGTPQRRASVPLDVPSPAGEVYAAERYKLWSAAGLAGVWAEENTREAIFDALQRKETFATSGPRIRVRFFASFDFDDGLASDPDMIARAYDRGVPMGGDLAASTDGPPRFLVWAIRDPNSVPLQRVQIVKGWVEDGEAMEKVFDVVCSDGLEPDETTDRCPDNGAEVDLSDCSFSRDLGAAELRALWIDPEFDSSRRAFYYLRVLENPKCRWSTWDAIRAGVDPNPDLPATIQDRAWSSPIWYAPVRE